MTLALKLGVVVTEKYRNSPETAIFLKYSNFHFPIALDYSHISKDVFGKTCHNLLCLYVFVCTIFFFYQKHSLLPFSLG